MIENRTGNAEWNGKHRVELNEGKQEDEEQQQTVTSHPLTIDLC